MQKDRSENRPFNPLIVGVICGIYPLLFYYSNNFSAINSWEHLGYFCGFFLGIPVLFFLILKLALRLVPRFKSYQNQILIVSVSIILAALTSWSMYLMVKKKIVLIGLVIGIFLAWRVANRFNKLLILILIMSVIPLFKNLIHIYEHQKKMEWVRLPDAVFETKFKVTPNIYLIQPDGYVGKIAMENKPYDFQNEFYNWLSNNDFKRYDHFRSNYPASLTSNSSMFSMKQHQFNDMLFPSLEMPNAREFISGNSSALETFRNNGYATHFIVEDEYFQQNRPVPAFDSYNIAFDEIPYFSNDNNVKKDVLEDLKQTIRDNKNSQQPQFFFVEKLLPHHIHFAASKDEERITYLEKIEEVNNWLKNAIHFISENDPDAIIIILADHGGWVGLNSYPEMFSTNNYDEIRSIYSVLAAIKWNGNLKENMDADLRSNVNLFRVLFATLSDKPELLENLEDNSSYNLKQGTFLNAVRAVLDNQGNLVAN